MLLSLFRLTWVILGTFLLVLTLLVLRVALPTRYKPVLQRRFRQAWGRFTCNTLGLKFRLHGPVPTGGCLIVANHQSWADPPILMAALGCTMLSKAEVANIPVVGWGARLVGVLFVHRERRSSRARAQQELSAELAAGAQANVFPEGTTGPGLPLLSFHMGSFKLAAQHSIAVVPVAIRYRHPDPWVDESLWTHFVRIAGRRQTGAEVFVGDAIQGSDGEALASACAAWITGQLS